MKKKQPNRQKHRRVKFDSSVTIYPVVESPSGHILEVPRKGLKAKSRDLSEGGIRLRLYDETPPVNILKVRFKIREESIDVFAKLIWQKGATCGFQYLVLHEDDGRQIRAYVKEQRLLARLAKKAGPLKDLLVVN